MVTSTRLLLGALGYVLAAESAGPALERLDPPRRAAVVMALLALVLTGLVLITCAMLGAHWVRRLARHKPGDRRTDPTTTDAIMNRRLRASLENILPGYKAGDTIHTDVSTKETKADPP
jgi:hypothetical protein